MLTKIYFIHIPEKKLSTTRCDKKKCCKLTRKVTQNCGKFVKQPRRERQIMTPFR